MANEYLTLEVNGHVVKHTISGEPQLHVAIDLTSLDRGSSAFGMSAQAVSALASKMRIPASVAEFFLRDKGILKP